MTDLAALTELHASLLMQARECERLAYEDNPNADRERIEALNYRAKAAALAALLEPQGVHVPPEGQLSLWGDGR